MALKAKMLMANNVDELDIAIIWSIFDNNTKSSGGAPLTSFNIERQSRRLKNLNAARLHRPSIQFLKHIWFEYVIKWFQYFSRRNEAKLDDWRHRIVGARRNRFSHEQRCFTFELCRIIMSFAVEFTSVGLVVNENSILTHEESIDDAVSSRDGWSHRTFMTKTKW